MYHKKFEYLLENDPDKVLSKTGIKIRKKVNWLFRCYMVPMSSKNKLHVERRTDIPDEKRVIYAATHGFRDDIAFSLAATGRHSYLLLGALNILFTSIHGIALWVNGVIAVDRQNKESRAAAVAKMRKAIDMGANILMFPEATWNKSKNLLVLELFPGIYDVAFATDAMVVPMASIEENGTVHVIIEEPFDIVKYGREDGIQVLRDKMATAKYELMEKYSHIKRADIGNESEYWNKYLSKLIHNANGLYNKKIESKSLYVNKKIVTYKEAFQHMKHITPSLKTAFLFRKKEKKL